MQKEGDFSGNVGKQKEISSCELEKKYVLVKRMVVLLKILKF
jgi:hypothetical protein